MLSVPEEFSEGIMQCLDEQGRFHFSRWGTEGMTKMSPLWLLKYLPNMPASHLAIYNDFRGPNNSLTMREAAANAALGEAFQIILRGSAESMLVGATGTRLHPMKMVHAVQQEEVYLGDGDPAAASRPVRPRPSRHGARRRGRRGRARRAFVRPGPRRDDLRRSGRRRHQFGSRPRGWWPSAIGRWRTCCGAVLRRRGRAPNDVGHLHAHGLSTRTSDADEARAIEEVFASRSTPPPVVAAKSHFGNLGAGSGLVELIASLLAVQHDRLFPILNYATPDPECPVAAVRNGDVRPGPSFINLNVTPQGQAAAVMVRRFA